MKEFFRKPAPLKRIYVRDETYKEIRKMSGNQQKPILDVVQDAVEEHKKRMVIQRDKFFRL